MRSHQSCVVFNFGSDFRGFVGQAAVIFEFCSGVHVLPQKGLVNEEASPDS